MIVATAVAGEHGAYLEKVSAETIFSNSTFWRWRWGLRYIYNSRDQVFEEKKIIEDKDG